VTGLPRRIGLLGGECTGKSTLARALGLLLPACVVDERLRRFVDDHGRAPRRDEQWSLMAEQQRAEDDAASACQHEWLVADPAPLMTAVYSLAYFDDDSLLADGIELAAGYRQLLWCDTDLPWTPDGSQRDGPAARQRVHALLTGIVRDRLTPLGVDVRLVSGPLQTRLGRAGLAWQPGP
jgi:nicotinamide riboside kinase